MDKIAFVDLETTGCSPLHDRVIEIGIVRVENNKIVQTYNKLVNPDCYISSFITNITGIASPDLEGAPSFYSIKEEVAEILDGCVFAAHNARFDYGFLRQEFKREGITFSAKQLCTAKLSRKLFPHFPRHNLDSIIERYGFTCQNRHRAYDDAKVLFDFYQVLQKTVAAELLEQTISTILKKPSLPSNLPSMIMDSIPDTSGVYIFYDEQKMPLYIGKSIHLKDRILSHFSDQTSSKEMKIATHINDIETIPTSGELGALLLESSLIKKMQPLYNRKLRNCSKITILKKYQNDDGYNSIRIEQKIEIDPSEIDDILGVFKSQKQAKEYLRGLAKYYYLCDSLLDLNHAKGACFSSKLGICKGACEKREKPLKYNMRFIEAFTKTRIKKWPFSGPIVIKEENETDSTGYILDQWCYLGKLNKEQEKEIETDITFDYDTYKILERYMKDPRHLRSIVNILGN